MAVRLSGSIFAKRMGFLASPRSVTAALIARVALAAPIASQTSASAEAIPGPPLTSARDRAGAFCPVSTSTEGSAAAFAAGVALTVIAARRRS